MNDISTKPVTLRQAVACGSVYCSAATIDRVEADDLPKEDLFGMARAAAYLTSKRTSDIIPHCHPVSIDGMEVAFAVERGNPNRIHIQVTGKSIGRTGIEMETLTAVSAAALVIYDHLKPIDKDLEIGGIRLLDKKGGKSDRIKRYAEGATAAILICSDSVAAQNKEDRAGEEVRKLLEKYGVRVQEKRVVPDEVPEIQSAVRSWVEQGLDLIVTCGGTGLGPRDNTPEALEPILETVIPGVSESMRSYGQDRTQMAMLSRSIAGSMGSSVVIAVPGSTNGALESMQAILPGIFHSRSMLRGEGH